MESLYIVMPAYNEEDNIRTTVEQWYPIIERYGDKENSKLVVVNDGSKDNTKEIGEELMERYPRFIMLTKENGGHGDSVLFAYRYAMEKGSDYIFQTDSDGQTNPDEFCVFWTLRHDYVAVIGNRQSSRKDGKDRVFVENVVRLLLRIIFGVSVEDANAPFRLMRTDVVKKYIDKMPKHFNLPNIMFTTYFAYFNEPIKFLEISFKPRQGGKNSINFKKIVKIGIQALKDFKYLKKHIGE